MKYTAVREPEISEIVLLHLSTPEPGEMLPQIKELLEEYKNDSLTITAIWKILIKHDVSKKPAKYFNELAEAVCEGVKKR